MRPLHTTQCDISRPVAMTFAMRAASLAASNSSIFSAQRPSDFSIAYLRARLALTPHSERAFLMNAIIDFIVPRLRERSTYVGFVGILTACGIAVEPEYVETALAIGTAVSSIILIVTKDKTAS